MTASSPLGTTAVTTTVRPSDLAYVSELVNKHSAIIIGPEKSYLVEQRLSVIARSEDVATIAELLALTRNDVSGRLVGLVVDAMTTNETSFFRDHKVYEFLRLEILPDILARNASTRTLRIWCAAAASGQEPYSIAMMLQESFAEVFDTWAISIVATDISPTMVERVKAARYSQLEINRGLPAKYLVKYFDRAGMDWELSPEIRKRITTREINLAVPLLIDGPFDLVMLRNVLIYFSIETKREVLQEVRRVLAPDGFLLMGSTESMMRVDETWERRSCGNVSCYQTQGHGGTEEGT